MVIGMTMIKVKPGQDTIAYESIKSIKGVKDIYRIFGEYSLFLIMEAYRTRDLDQIIDEIHMRRGVVEIRPVLVTEDCELPCPNVSESEEPAFS
jgi:hypothetical protein